MRIGIVVGSIRDGRRGEQVGRWALEHASSRGDAVYEMIDVRAFDVPLLTSSIHPMRAGGQYVSAAVTEWSRTVDRCDGFVFVTPEYNHGVPGAFKNAVDCLGPEWVGKTIGFVSYGTEGGVRAVEQWRNIAANLQMLDVRQQVVLSIFTDFDEEGRLAASERKATDLSTLLDQLTDLTRRLLTAAEQSTP